MGLLNHPDDGVGDYWTKPEVDPETDRLARKTLKSMKKAAGKKAYEELKALFLKHNMLKKEK